MKIFRLFLCALVMFCFYAFYKNIEHFVGLQCDISRLESRVGDTITLRRIGMPWIDEQGKTCCRFDLSNYLRDSWGELEVPMSANDAADYDLFEFKIPKGPERLIFIRVRSRMHP